jgi:hypothetical protein
VATLKARSSPNQFEHLGAPPIRPTDEDPRVARQAVLGTLLGRNLADSHTGKGCSHSVGMVIPWLSSWLTVGDAG